MPDIITNANAHCVGGHPDSPDLSDFPLLCWALDHDRHGNEVFTEDGAVSVHDVAAKLAETSNLAVLAQRFGTSEAHIGQAVAYAVKAKLLG